MSINFSRLALLPLAIVIFPFCLASCSSGGNSTDSGMSDKEYRDYLASTEVQSDLELFYEFALKADNLKMSIILAMTDGDEFFNDEVDEDEADSIFLLMEEIIQKGDEYEEALLRLENSKFFNTATPTSLKKGLEGMGLVKAGKDLLNECRGAGQTVREWTMEVFLSDGVKSDANRKALFNELSSELKQGASDYKEWWRNFNAGEYDASSGRIFNAFLTGTSRASEAFASEAGMRRLDNSAVFTSIGPRLLESGFNLIVEATGNIIPGAMSIGVNIGANAVKTVEILATAAGRKISDISADIAEGILNMIPGYGDVKATIDMIPSAEEVKATINTFKNYIEDKINSYSDPSEVDVARISYDDEDETEAKVLVAIDQGSGKATLSFGSATDNSVSANLPEGNYIVTAVDEEGDKFTEEISLEAGDIIEKTIETNESEILEELASSSSTRFNDDEESSSSRRHDFDFDDESSSSEKSESELCDPYELGQEGYTNCLFIGEWTPKKLSITCETYNENYDYSDGTGANCTLTFKNNGIGFWHCTYDDGDEERTEFEYSVDLTSALPELSMDDGTGTSVVTITLLGQESNGEFYLSYNSSSKDANGEKCYENYSFTR